MIEIIRQIAYQSNKTIADFPLEEVAILLVYLGSVAIGVTTMIELL